MSWSPQQEQALKAVTTWINQAGGSQVFRLFGFAGTGKSTLAREIAAIVGGRVCFAAFTGKAAMVMRSKGCANASTIHSLIYVLDEENGGQPTFVINIDSKISKSELVIIDECSMVDKELGVDLLSFGKKVLVLGDPAQLPPVKGAGYFTSAEPDVMLTEVHRQARDNPIIRMSMDVREGGRVSCGSYGNSAVLKRANIDSSVVMEADQVLVGMNATRGLYNGRIRELKGIKSPLPVVDDRLVCLRNERHKGLLNGSLWTVAKLKKRKTSKNVNMVVRSIDAGVRTREVSVSVLPAFFEGNEAAIPWEDKRGLQDFTYGYALTVHKSQGSQWDNVCLFDESHVFHEHARRWLYTGITRAAERITVVV